MNDFTKEMDDATAKKGAGLLENLDAELQESMGASIPEILSNTKNLNRQLGSEKDAEKNYKNIKQFKDKQTKILNLLKDVIKDYSKLSFMQQNQTQKDEVKLIISFINKGLSELKKLLKLKNDKSKSVENLARTIALSIARAYEIFGAAILTLAFEGTFILTGKAGQNSSKKQKTLEVEFNGDKIRISKHIDAVLKLGNVNNKIYIALDVKSSSEKNKFNYTYNQSDSIQEIFKAARNNGLATSEDLIDFAYVFVNMAYFEPTQAKNIEPFNDFIKNFIAVNFAQEYVEHMMADPNMVPIIQINFKHFLPSELLQGFLEYASSQKLPFSNITLPKNNSGSPVAGRYGNYMQGGDFGRMLIDKRDVVQKLREVDKNTGEYNGEPFYTRVFSQTEKHHEKITKNILNMKQKVFYTFQPTKHTQKIKT